jgi:tetratricopeptide (TPR) repeat protein
MAIRLITMLSRAFSQPPEIMSFRSVPSVSLAFIFSRSVVVSALLLLSVQLIARGEDAKAPAVDPELSVADRLCRAGKLVEAEERYRALIRADPKSVPAQVGLVRVMLGENKIDEALDSVNAALAVQSISAALLAVKGDVEFRRAQMSYAESSYLAAKKLDAKELGVYLGLARLYDCASMHRKSYEELQVAHEIAPDDPAVQRAWMSTLPRKERLAALEAYLGAFGHDNEEETKQLTEYLESLKSTADTPIHACRIVSKVDQTERKLETVYGVRRRLPGIGLEVGVGMPQGRGLSIKLNKLKVSLLLDTGAGGIMVSRRVAEKAGLTRISAIHFGGVGDRGLQRGYTAVADHIRIGELEFQDCVVGVSDNGSVVGVDGLIGADVFGDYLIDIDYPEMRLKLSPLPTRPEDKIGRQSLNSEGEELGNVEQNENSGTEQPALSQEGKSDASGSSSPIRVTKNLYMDRYIAPDMANWTKVFRFGHDMLVPTYVNDSNAMLFELDTGAFANTLSLQAGLKADNVVPDSGVLRVRGLSGEARAVYSGKATLSFGHLQQMDPGIVILDLSRVSHSTGTEISGFLGFSMLRLLEVKLDYRDGLVDFVYDSKRGRP